MKTCVVVGIVLAFSRSSAAALDEWDEMESSETIEEGSPPGRMRGDREGSESAGEEGCADGVVDNEEEEGARMLRSVWSSREIKGGAAAGETERGESEGEGGLRRALGVEKTEETREKGMMRDTRNSRPRCTAAISW